MGWVVRPQFMVGMAIASLAALSFGFATANLNICKDFIIVDMGWCKGEGVIYDCPRSRILAGVANGSVFAGAALGSIIMNFVSHYGRRINIIAISWLYILGSTLAATAFQFTTLVIGRLTCGIAIGLSGVVPMFITEICPSESRGFFGIFYPAFITFGQFASCAFQLLHGRVVCADGEPQNVFHLLFQDKFLWRFCQMFPAIFSVISLILLYFFFTTDTPYELVERGKTEEAKAVIEKLHGMLRTDEIYEEIDKDQEIAKATPNIPFMHAINNKTYRRAIINGIILAIFQHLTGIAILTSNTAKIFLLMLGRTYTAVVLSCSITLLNVIVTIALFPFIEKFGRKTFLVTSICIFTTFSTITTFSKFIGGDEDWVKWVSVGGSVGFVIGFSMGMGGVFWLYVSEMYGSEYKNGAYSMTVLANWTTASLVLTASEPLLSYSESLVNFMIFAFSVMNLFHVVFFIKETKGVPLGKAYN
ncbi:hexose transporter, putative [Theileria equi strain WA]|uniref:Hexose transporter, putative n=1 Tax=Theileria equi strain WA TaxID=1537102 RepID=L1LAS7_THEEQ|nr:hexose transporter, putative [Theileria equi strain WA]EKX72385.1 hexose transporter, putative [Theileria equi strain WA]|eukprot:XP_004831837.1 hexose transporter, putative [Theileria equi strain WA]